MDLKQGKNYPLLYYYHKKSKLPFSVDIFPFEVDIFLLFGYNVLVNHKEE